MMICHYKKRCNTLKEKDEYGEEYYNSPDTNTKLLSERSPDIAKPELLMLSMSAIISLRPLMRDPPAVPFDFEEDDDIC